MRHLNYRLLATLTFGLAVAASPAVAQKKYDPGASDTEIKIGNINPYSGPASALIIQNGDFHVWGLPDEKDNDSEPSLLYYGRAWDRPIGMVSAGR